MKVTSYNNGKKRQLRSYGKLLPQIRTMTSEHIFRTKSAAVASGCESDVLKLNV
jgi:hypothetical protein